MLFYTVNNNQPAELYFLMAITTQWTYWTGTLDWTTRQYRSIIIAEKVNCLEKNIRDDKKYLHCCIPAMHRNMIFTRIFVYK